MISRNDSIRRGYYLVLFRNALNPPFFTPRYIGIHQRLIKDQKAALESGDKMQPGNIQIDEDLYKEVISVSD